MARVHTQTKSNRGKPVRCGRDGCGRTIEPGERYYSFSFRSGGSHARCVEHYPRPSELTQSKMSTVYAAVEEAESLIEAAEEVGVIKDAVANVAETVREVVEEYREAAEPFQGQGENAERADELEGWADELENYEPDEPEEEPTDEEREEAVRAIVTDAFDSPSSPVTGYTSQEAVLGLFDFSDLDAVIAVFMIDEAILGEKVQEIREEGGSGSEALDEARSAATELIGGCPL